MQFSSHIEIKMSKAFVAYRLQRRTRYSIMKLTWQYTVAASECEGEDVAEIEKKEEDGSREQGSEHRAQRTAKDRLDLL